MRISITGKNIEVSEYLRDLTEKKMSKLDRYFPSDTVAQVTMEVEKNRHIVEVTIPYSGGIIRGEEVTGDMYASIDNVIAKLERQIIRYRTKLEKNLKAEAFNNEPVPEYEEEDEGPAIVKVKRFSIKPMSAEEAILQMNLLGHEFFVFRNMDADSAIAVVYKRKQGGYGLICDDGEDD